MHIWQRFGTVAGLMRLWIKNQTVRPRTLYGKVTFLATLGAAALLCFVFFAFFDTSVPRVSADNVTTSVTVLNTPPQWTVDAQEDNYDSSTSTPTNAGDIIRWRTIGTDPSADPYWLIICKNNLIPTPNANAAPTCSGGVANQWAVSNGTTTGGGTTSGFVAIAATTTKETFPFNAEKNDWYGWICDGNASLPQCNALVKQGVSTPGPSPFFIDHPPTFVTLAANGPQIPGANLTWTTTASTTDFIRGGGVDKLRLYVCKAADFTSASSTAGCGAGGTWATSTLSVTNPSASYSIPIPTQDKTYSAFIYLTNNFNLAATSTLEASSSPYVVSNVAPTVTAATVTFLDPVHSSSTIVLSTPNGQSGPYWIQAQINDNNGCQNAASGNEIASLSTAVYRSGIGTTSCRYNISGDYNTNNCYPSASSQTNFVCTQDAGSCTVGTVSSTWTCTVSLWYNADPTDTGSQFAGQKWGASVVATDDNGATSTLAESTSGSKTLTSFLAFAVTQTSLAFGGLQPGQQNDPLSTTTATTTLRALGNTGVDQSIYGSTMCTNWSALGGGSNPDACDTIGVDATKQIPIVNQKVGTSSVAYASPFAYPLSGSTTPVLVGIHVQKTTSTTTPNSKNSFFGINIPSAITLAGAYTGQDTIIAVTSSSTNW